MSLIGTLAEVKIGDVLRLLATGRKTGVLTLAHDAHKAVLGFEKGKLVHATAGRLQGDDAVLDLFGWSDGQLTFAVSEVREAPNVSRSVDALVLEGLRVGGLVHRIHEVLPSERLVFQMGPGPPDEAFRFPISPTAWRVARLLDGVRDVREVVEASRLPRAEVQRALVEMFDAGLLERFDVGRSVRIQVQGLFGREAVELDERYERDWMKLLRFHGGVKVVELRALSGRSRRIDSGFRAGLGRDAHLPRGVVSEMQLRDGDEVTVRPVA